MNKLITAIHGFCMSLADSVPGVSGGTVAFLMGFYDNFINALGNLITGSWEERKKAFFYLINLGIGWIIGFLMAVVVLSSLFESHIYTVSSLFIGFIIFAIPLVIMEEKQCLKDRACMSFFLLIGIAIVAAITHLNPVGGTDNSLNLDNPGLLMYLYIFIAGAIAICAMILPGISGSTLMLIFGLYVPIITGIKDLLHLDFHALPLLIAFGLGIITGVISIIKIIQRDASKCGDLAPVGKLFECREILYLYLSLYRCQFVHSTESLKHVISLGNKTTGRRSFHIGFHNNTSVYCFDFRKVDGFQHHGDGMEIKATGLFQLKEAHGSQLGKIVYGQDPSDTCQFRYFQRRNRTGCCVLFIESLKIQILTYSSQNRKLKTL